MNYLAHAYLSFGNPEITVGNMISDFVKGKKKFDYPAGIQQGITLHRLIDTFTDTHPATKEAKEIFRPYYRLYSGALVDIVYDHFLATDETEFPGNSLLDFSQGIYNVLESYAQWLPLGFAGMFPFMKSQNWLFHYREKSGIAKSLEGLIRRAVYLTDSRPAYQQFEEHYQLLRSCYRQFWKDLEPFARLQYDGLKDY